MADYNEQSREVSNIDNKGGNGCGNSSCYCTGDCRSNNGNSDLSIKLAVDVSDALTGLKAVQREAREATKAVRALEAEGVRVTVDGDTVYRTVRASDSYIGTSGNIFLRSSSEGKVNSSGRNLRIKIGEGMYDSSILIIDDDTGNLTKITDLKELLSDVTTAQLVEELASRDGVVRAEYSAGDEVTVDGRELSFISNGFVIDGVYEEDD